MVVSRIICCVFPQPSGIYGVGKAAEHPPALAVLSHTPDGATQTIAWVGKGIVYDTGGLSIKGKVCHIKAVPTDAIDEVINQPDSRIF